MPRAAAIAACILIAACTRGAGDAPAGARVVAARETAPPVNVADAGAKSAALSAGAGPDGGGADDGGNESALATFEIAAPVGGRSIGHTSVVFKVKLEGGLEAAYKPRSTRGDGRYKGEIAAYRLARALGLDNVPPAIPRSFDGDALARAVGREKTFAEVVREPGGEVRGALVPWIQGLEFLPLEQPGEMARWRAWLRPGGAIPDDHRALAAQISTALAFDYVTGNWDRWSGGNVGFDRARGRLLFIDNDGAFFDPAPVKEMKRPIALFEGASRFSRAFVGALRAVDVAGAVGDEVPGTPLLSPRVLGQTDDRRKKVLAAIDAKIAKLGEPAVLAFE